MKKLVCVTPAGRRRYMKNLIPQIISSDIVSRYDIWLNTTDEEDLKFFYFLRDKFPKVNLVELPEGKVNGNRSINAFFKTAMNEDEIYIRMDDDIAWIMPGFFDELYKIRTNDNDSFIISPIVINNAISTHILQQDKKFTFNEYLPPNCMHPLTWGNPEFAFNLHLWFLNLLKNNSFTSIKTNDYLISLNRFSINSICWLGSDFKKFNGVVLNDEEEYLTVIKPAELNKVNKIIGSLLVAHYSFYTQREFLDSTDLIDQYELAVRKSYEENLTAIQMFREIDLYFKGKTLYSSPAPKFNIKYLKGIILNLKLPVLKLKKLKDII